MPGNNKPPSKPPKGQKWFQNGLTPEGQINWALMPKPGGEASTSSFGKEVKQGPIDLTNQESKPKKPERTSWMKDWELKNDK